MSTPIAGAAESEAWTTERTPGQRFYQNLVHNESIPCAVLGALGVVFDAFVVKNVLIEQTTLSVALHPFIALVQGVLPALALFYAARKLQHSDLMRQAIASDSRRSWWASVI